MILGRRHRHRRRDRIRHLLWPRRGLKRGLLYVWHRLGRLQDSAHSIALGVACGVMLSFTPLFGLHILLAALLAWALGGNPLAAFFGTFAGNPGTYPLIWLWSYRLGAFLLGTRPAEPVVVAALHHPLGALGDAFLPLLVGGTPLGLIAAAISYLIVRSAVAGYQNRRRQRRTSAVRGRPISPANGGGG